MFIDLTHTNEGRILVNVEHIVSIVEEAGIVLLAVRDASEGVEVLETYDDIMSRINTSRQKVW